MNLSAGVNQFPPPASFPGSVQSKALLLDGSKSGTSSLTAPATGGGSQTLPQGDGTIADIDQPQFWRATQTNMPLVKPTIGGGSPITQVLLHTGALKFSAIAAGTCQEQNLEVDGAKSSGTVAASPEASFGNYESFMAGLGHIGKPGCHSNM